MPSSAQHEYIRVYAREGATPDNDCNVLATLAKGIENGTLFDIIFGDLIDGKPDYERRPMGLFRSDGNQVAYLEVGSLSSIEVVHTSAQYAALFAIQLELDRLDGSVFNSVPVLTVGEGGYLVNDDGSTPILTPEGYYYNVSTDNYDRIVTVENSYVKADVQDTIYLDEHLAQKLIGLPTV